MFLREDQVRNLTGQFMPRLKESSIAAMIDVASNGFSLLASAQKHKVTHQSLSKNLTSLKELQSKIVSAGSSLSASYLLKQNVIALLMKNVPFSDSVSIIGHMCEKLGGKIDSGGESGEFRMYLDDVLITIYLNPDESYDYTWAYSQCELK